ncbi:MULTISPECIES: hypothetical protein [unclassified Bosea (in: a-proteobacteria)]|uniref:hypothetical protein n=1 Tax=unclassified Bosea (in: a-proteobacteria) TaxID=2653178 RepID=UPI000F74E863|nr:MULTISPECIES: hypothetical protein [unclassified Bosea (in: a-proteobacteria)]AZO78638.1 hypothetical protein BLM15_14170 [Bosea sp. Tri-49]RXT17575.1 hypothetical protein B5U98_26260 [Bosea sp. Tri-39]RXT40947.1 hypothetical protein B5U99_04130 [Bosea sp. Tri-54]
MRFSRPEQYFAAAGVGLGAFASLAVNNGWIAKGGTFPPFVYVLLALALVEVVAGFVTKQAPGTLFSMPARILAFALGIGVLILLTGGLA